MDLLQNPVIGIVAIFSSALLAGAVFRNFMGKPQDWPRTSAVALGLSVGIALTRLIGVSGAMEYVVLAMLVAASVPIAEIAFARKARPDR